MRRIRRLYLKRYNHVFTVFIIKFCFINISQKINQLLSLHLIGEIVHRTLYRSDWSFPLTRTRLLHRSCFTGLYGPFLFFCL